MNDTLQKNVSKEANFESTTTVIDGLLEIVLKGNGKKVADLLTNAIPTTIQSKDFYAVEINETQEDDNVFIELLKRFIQYLQDNQQENFRIKIKGISLPRRISILTALKDTNYADFGGTEEILLVGVGEE